ncbi:MAG TPA: protein kinase, partial [Gemmatimonadales bacterium]
SPALLSGEGMVERFKREARTAASLSHPNIIPIYAVKESEQIVYFVMKFIEGRPLDAIIKEGGRLPIPLVQQLLSQVGAALGYAHKRGIIHRDVKPANVMVDTDGWAVVTDFGIAKVTEAKGLTMTGATVGTPSYMSPEQCAAKELTGASDQYSLGVVAYEMLAGKLPFVADSIMAIMYAHFNEPPPPITDVRPDCPPQIAAALTRMLAKEPGDRFPSVEDAIAAFGAVQLAADDPIRTQLLTLAASGKNTDILKRISTPASPSPMARTRGATVGTTGGTGFSLTPAQVSVAAGGAVQLTATLKGSGGKTLAGPRVTWASTEPGVATVSAQGLVTALAAGSAVITCTCEGASATAAVTVTAARPAKSRRGLLVGAGVLVTAAAIAAVILKPWAAPVASPGTPTTTTTTPPLTTTPAGPPPATSQQSGPKPVPPVIETHRPASAPAGHKPANAGNGAASAPAPQPQTSGAAQQPATTGSAATPVVNTPAPTPPPAPVDPTPQIRDAIAAYQKAIASGSVTAVRQAYPGLTDAQAANWATFFGLASGITTEYHIADLQHGDDAATVTVQGVLHFTVQRTKQDQPSNYRATLTRSGGVWRITAIE